MPIADIYSKRFSYGGKTQVSIMDVEAMILGEWSADEILASVPNGRAIQLQWQKTKKLSSKELLHFLLTSILRKEQALTFDHFSLHQSCIAFLHAARFTLKDEIKNSPSDQDITNLPLSIFHLQIEQSLPEDALQGFGLREGSQSALDMTGDVLKELLLKWGNPEYSDIRKILLSIRPGASLSAETNVEGSDNVFENKVRDRSEDGETDERKDEGVEKIGRGISEADEMEGEGGDRGPEDGKAGRGSTSESDSQGSEESTDLLKLLRKDPEKHRLLPRKYLREAREEARKRVFGSLDEKEDPMTGQSRNEEKDARPKHFLPS
ncbi:MAG: hypothetical protein MMC33_005993 [Icmadophila ericetorum]|nr:hypothetical protein [Icmadophila ericetorum]